MGAVAAAGWLLSGLPFAWAAEPLTEADLVRLIQLGIGERVIVEKIEKDGVAFPLDPETLKRLGEAGATATIQAALQKPSQPVPAVAPAAPITHDDVLGLLKQGLGEDAVLERLSASPTVFQLSSQQAAELKAAGASDKLLAALAGDRPQAESTGDVTDFAILLDCSGSMMEQMQDGQPKMETAKRVIADLVQKIPDGLRLTFIIYGHDKAQECQAVQVMRELAPIDAAGKAELVGRIDVLRPAGATPIALALRAAGQELAKENASSGLVLISDGKETCQGNPAAEAAQLAQTLNLSFGVNVVGFDVKPDERAALEQIAQAGRGQYYNAASATELAQALSTVQQELQQVAGLALEDRPTRQYEAAGQAAEPGSFFHDAAPISSGEYQGQLAFMQAHFYQVPVRQGQEMRLIAQIVKSPLESHLHPLDQAIRQDFVLTLYDENFNVLAREVAQVLDNPQTPVTLRVVNQPQKDGIVYVSLGASANYDNWGKERGPLQNEPQPSAYTLRLRLDGQDTAATTPAGATGASLLDVNPGNGFPSAGTVASDGLVAGDLKFGEAAFYRVPVTKGETLTVSFGAQKPFESGQNVSYRQLPKGQYQITVYDDDQVEVAKQVFEIEGNPPDAASTTIAWPVELSGNAYLVVSLTKAGNNAEDPNNPPLPGRFALIIRKG